MCHKCSKALAKKTARKHTWSLTVNNLDYFFFYINWCCECCMRKEIHSTHFNTELFIVQVFDLFFLANRLFKRYYCTYRLSGVNNHRKEKSRFTFIIPWKCEENLMWPQKVINWRLYIPSAETACSKIYWLPDYHVNYLEQTRVAKSSS